MPRRIISRLATIVIKVGLCMNRNLMLQHSLQPVKSQQHIQDLHFSINFVRNCCGCWFPNSQLNSNNCQQFIKYYEKYFASEVTRQKKDTWRMCHVHNLDKHVTCTQNEIQLNSRQIDPVPKKLQSDIPKYFMNFSPYFYFLFYFNLSKC